MTRTTNSPFPFPAWYSGCIISLGTRSAAKPSSSSMLSKRASPRPRKQKEKYATASLREEASSTRNVCSRAGKCSSCAPISNNKRWVFAAAHLVDQLCPQHYVTFAECVCCRDVAPWQRGHRGAVLSAAMRCRALVAVRGGRCTTVRCSQDAQAFRVRGVSSAVGAEARVQVRAYLSSRLVATFSRKIGRICSMSVSAT
eukprot:1187129-Prorocentrum_minimum.AAC.3